MAMEASLGIEGGAGESGVDDIQTATETAPIVRYVNLLILQALNERASDIHIEPTETDLRIRYRIDGVLHDVSTGPKAIAAAVTTRLKVMADMNIAEHRVPQDGRISLNVGAKGIDLRMATLPTIYGEKIVMRVLDKSSVVLGFAELGFDPDMLRSYEELYTKPYGTILVSGPTGSGKSTTLYTTLTALNSPEKNIITVEDPVEVPLKGVNQVQLNVKAGLTFAGALRAILRSDPDIVLVGEIRDKETASIAIEAALTGHMVLATLHTNSAAATPMRLIEMGIEPFLVTSALSGVVAQRLARRLCMHCKEPFEPTEADISAAGWTLAEVEAAGVLGDGEPLRRMLRLFPDGLPGPSRSCRTDAYDRGGRAHDHRRRLGGGDPPARRQPGHGRPPSGRTPQGHRRGDHARGSAAGGRMTSVTSSTRHQWNSRLASALVEAGYETSAGVQPLVEEADATDQSLGYLLISRGRALASVVVGTLSQLAQLPAVDLSAFTPQPEAAAALPVELGVEFGAMAVQIDGRALVVAFSDPPEPSEIDDLAGRVGYRIHPVLADPMIIAHHLGTDGPAARGGSRQPLPGHGRPWSTISWRRGSMRRARTIRCPCTSTTCSGTRCPWAPRTSTSRRPCRAPSGSTARCAGSKGALLSTTRPSGT